MTQEQLRQFVAKEARKGLLSCPPFNIPHMLGTAVVCLLFPGIVLGQSRAIGITVALLASLLATWLWDAGVWTERLLIFWGIWSAAVWALWQLILFLIGLSSWHKARRWQKPDSDEKEGLVAPWEKVLHWEAAKSGLSRNLSSRRFRVVSLDFSSSVSFTTLHASFSSAFVNGSRTRVTPILNILWITEISHGSIASFMKSNFTIALAI
jgi:hypothetical protein